MSDTSADTSTGKTLDLIREYLENRATILKLQSIKSVARLTSFFVWVVMLLVLVILLIVFLGIVSGFWFSSLTGSHVSGFAISSGLILVLIVILSFMKNLLVNPVIRALIKNTTTPDEKEEE